MLAGIHDYLLDELLPVYTGVEHLVLVGDDLSIPFARLPDEAVLHLESSYTAGDDLTAASPVGAALAGDFYLSDDPLAVLDDFTPGDLGTSVFVPDLAIGRLVETPDEIISTIATFISQDGVLDLTAMDPDTGHKALVTGYDFLLDSASVIRERWKTALGVSTPDDLDRAGERRADRARLGRGDGGRARQRSERPPLGQRRGALRDREPQRPRHPLPGGRARDRTPTTSRVSTRWTSTAPTPARARRLGGLDLAGRGGLRRRLPRRAVGAGQLCG